MAAPFPPHPKDMTPAERDRLPVVNRFLGPPVFEFVDRYQRVWKVGISGSIYVRTGGEKAHPTSPPKSAR